MKAKITCMALLCAILWAGCSGKKSEYEVVNTASSASDTVKGDGSASAASVPKLVKTADMRFRVKDVNKTGEDISVLTTKYQGMVMHHSLQSTTERSQDIPINSDSVMRVSAVNTAADMTIRLPSAHLEEFMNQVSRMAVYINNRDMDIQDKSLDYLASQMKISGRNQIIAQQSTGRIKIKNPADVMQLKDDLVDEQINNKRIDAAVKYSTVGLTFYQSHIKTNEVLINDDPATFRIPFFSRLRIAFENGCYIFNETIIAIANLWLFALCGLAIWFVYRSYKRKHIANAV